MDIYPQDLGPRVCAQVLQVRDAGQVIKMMPVADVSVSPSSPAKRLDDYNRGSARVATFCMLLMLLGIAATYVVSGDPAPVVLLTPLFLGGFICLTGPDRKRARAFFGGKVTPDELSGAQQRVSDPLAQEFLMTLGRLAFLPSQGATEDQHIRQAVRSLGLVLEKLPTQAAGGVPSEPGVLRAEAAGLAEQARQETDGVVAASLERQAAALTRQAETAHRLAGVVRRNQTLRQEIAAQVKAFQVSLIALEMGGHPMAADFAALAENVAQVAHEADALADARAELEAALAPAAPAAGQDAPAPPVRLKTT